MYKENHDFGATFPKNLAVSFLTVKGCPVLLHLMDYSMRMLCNKEA
jgi:hypothetical protein